MNRPTNISSTQMNGPPNTVSRELFPRRALIFCVSDLFNILNIGEIATDTNSYLKCIKFNTGFILERSNLVVLILVPWEILKIFFPVSQMIWMQNLIEIKKNAISDGFRSINYVSNIFIRLKFAFEIFFLDRINFKHRTNFSPWAKD